MKIQVQHGWRVPKLSTLHGFFASGPFTFVMPRTSNQKAEKRLSRDNDFGRVYRPFARRALKGGRVWKRRYRVTDRVKLCHDKPRLSGYRTWPGRRWKRPDLFNERGAFIG